MILDLEKFIGEEKVYWAELEAVLDRIEEDPALRLTLKETRRLHYLYQRATAGLSKIVDLPSERETRRYLENLVARSFGEIHENRQKAHRFVPWTWFFRGFPRSFRRYRKQFALAVIATILGAVFGVAAVTIDPDSKEILLPFSHLLGDPSERVAQEEQREKDELKGAKITFSSYLMTHNTRVAIFCMAMGLTFGIGTVILLFYNGSILGAVALDYIRAGETTFLLGWLMPHGVIEIPAIIISGQVGLILAGVLLGKADGRPLGERFRSVSSDAVTLIFGVAVLLVWAGIIEAFMSQYHQPVIPYSLKIGFGAVELGALVFLLFRSGLRHERDNR
jgi:uncharacterized membrane protein SpoIIM required for sporulation